MTSMAVADLGRIPMSANLAATLQRATEYARAQSHLEVTLEHLLLALIEDMDAGLVLAASSVDAARIAADVSSHIGRIEERSAQGDAVQLSVSADLRRILEAAAAAAHQGRRRDINGAIVLAAIVGDAKSTAAHLLSAHGLTFEGAIRALQKANAAAAAQAAEPPAAQPAPRPLPPPEPLPAPPEPHREAPPAPRPVPAAAAPPMPEPPEARPQQAGGTASNMEELLAQARERVRQRQGQGYAAGQGHATGQSGQPAGQGNGPPPGASQPGAAPPAQAPQPPQQRPGEMAERRDGPETPAPAADRQGSGFEPDWGPAIEPPAPAPSGPPPPARPPLSAPPPPFAPPPRGPAPPAAVAPPPPPVHPHRPMPSERLESQRPGPAQPPPRTAEPLRPGEPQRGGTWPPMAGPPPQAASGAPQRPTRLPPPLPGGAGTGQSPPGPGTTMPGPAASPAAAPPPLPPRREPSELAPGGTMPPWAGDGGTRPPDMAARPGERTRAPAGPPGPHQAAADKRARAPSLPAVEIGQLVENIPKTMRVGIAAKAEVRIGKADVKALAEGLQGGGGVWRHDVVVTKAMSVRLRAPDGGFFIESGSPETQWIENTLGLMADDYASWRWTITPKDRGWKRLQLVVSARTVGGDGVAAETALPDQVIDVRVRTNYSRAFARIGGWALAALAGGVVAKVGEGAFVAAWQAMLKSAGG